MNQELHVVTGAFGYSGKYIATRLLAEGQRVRTLTNSGQRTNQFDGKIEIYPFNFDRPADLVESLRGANVLYNTYWVRFNYSFFKHASAVQNTLILFEAARQAGVKRVVHISITNPSEDSPWNISPPRHTWKELCVSLTFLTPFCVPPYSLARKIS
jgi:nucleoside-diphosphate-sugar epimerase